MEAYEREAGGLRYIAVHPDGYDASRRYPLVTLLHGFGANMQDLAGLAPLIDSSGYVYAFPNGPETVELAPGYVGYSWTHPDRRRDPAEDAKTREKLLRHLDEVMADYGVEAGKAVVGGFSQGGRLAYLCGLDRPEVFAGVVALGAAVFDTAPLEELLPGVRDQAVFIGHGAHDATVPVEQAQMMRAFLEGAGYAPEYHEYAIGHEISRQLVADMSAWLRRTLPPVEPGA